MNYLLLKIDASILKKIEVKPIAIFFEQSLAEECLERERLHWDDEGFEHILIETPYP